MSGAYVHPFTYTRMTMNGRQDGDGANVLGLCLGTDPKLPYFVVSAHYDHLGIRDGQIYPGADDDASGVAVILELAAFCQKTPFRHTILFAAFDAEERGLQGAKAFLVKPPVPQDRIALNVNLDMVSRSDKREIFIAGTYHYPDLKAPLEEVARRAPITVLFGHDKPVAVAGGVDDWTNQSDHGPFHAAKIPFVYFGVEDHADYHKPTDTADKINRGFFVDVAETILDAVLALDRVEVAMEQQLFDAIKAGRVDEVRQLVQQNSVAEAGARCQRRLGDPGGRLQHEAGCRERARRARRAGRHLRSQRARQGRSHPGDPEEQPGASVRARARRIHARRPRGILRSARRREGADRGRRRRECRREERAEGRRRSTPPSPAENSRS